MKTNPISIPAPDINNPSWMIRLPVVLLASGLFGIIFRTLFSVYPNPVITNLTLGPAIVIAWLWGRKAGLLTILFNHFCIIFVIRTIAPEQKPELSAFIAISAYSLITFLIGTASTLTKKLKQENLERLKVTEQLRKYQEQLEQMVEERTKELSQAHEKLKQIEKMEAVGQLAGGVAHDFNNQLAVILGYSEFLATVLEDPKLKHYASQIRTSGARAADLTKQLLTFSRKSSYKSQIVNTNHIVTEVTTLLSRSIGQEITLVHVLGSTKPQVWGSASLLQNAILNLAINARDAMEQGGVLTIETSDLLVDQTFCKLHGIQLEYGEYVSIAVADTGTGIAPTVLPHIFEPFFTTKCEGKGTGMGLAAVYGTVNSHHGTVLVESIFGKGATFKVLLPVTNRTRNEDDFTGELSENADGENILLIGDEQEFTDLMKVILNSLGYEISNCSEKQAAHIYKGKWGETNAVIIDTHSFENSLKVYNSLKEINPEIVAIFVSGFSSNQKLESVHKAGVSGFLQKPFTRKDIHRKIQECLLRKNVVKRKENC